MTTVFQYDPGNIPSTRNDDGPNIGVTPGTGTLLWYDVDKVTQAELLTMFSALKEALLAAGVVPE